MILDSFSRVVVHTVKGEEVSPPRVVRACSRRFLAIQPAVSCREWRSFALLPRPSTRRPNDLSSDLRGSTDGRVRGRLRPSSRWSSTFTAREPRGLVSHQIRDCSNRHSDPRTFCRGLWGRERLLAVRLQCRVWPVHRPFLTKGPTAVRYRPDETSGACALRRTTREPAICHADEG
jgi:hypothetical protein